MQKFRLRSLLSRTGLKMRDKTDRIILSSDKSKKKNEGKNNKFNQQRRRWLREEKAVLYLHGIKHFHAQLRSICFNEEYANMSLLTDESILHDTRTMKWFLFVRRHIIRTRRPTTKKLLSSS